MPPIFDIVLSHCFIHVYCLFDRFKGWFITLPQLSRGSNSINYSYITNSKIFQGLVNVPIEHRYNLQQILQSDRFAKSPIVGIYQTLQGGAPQIIFMAYNPINYSYITFFNHSENGFMFTNLANELGHHFPFSHEITINRG